VSLSRQGLTPLSAPIITADLISCLVTSTHIVIVDNSLTGERILVSDLHRMKRPCNGQFEPPQAVFLPEYDPNCYLYSGNKRATGQQKEKKYEHTKVFSSDYASDLSPSAPVARAKPTFCSRVSPWLARATFSFVHPRRNWTFARFYVGRPCTYFW
jgi:Galactose-1-phosphate uridyl transferase, N-terminal domain